MAPRPAVRKSTDSWRTTTRKSGSDLVGQSEVGWLYGDRTLKCDEDG